MTPLLRAAAVCGVLLGLTLAVAIHYASIARGGYWFAYAQDGGELDVTWAGAIGWPASCAIALPVGLVLGLAPGVVLQRLGWQLRRQS